MTLEQARILTHDRRTSKQIGRIPATIPRKTINDDSHRVAYRCCKLRPIRGIAQQKEQDT